MGYKNMYSFKFSCSRPKQHYHNSYIYHVSCHIIPASLAPALPILNAYFSLFCQCICKASGEFPSLIPLHTLPESSQKDASYLLLQIPPHDIYILWCLQGAKPFITAGVSWESRDHRRITLKNALFEQFDAHSWPIHVWLRCRCPNRFLHLLVESWPLLMKENKQRNSYR